MLDNRHSGRRKASLSPLGRQVKPAANKWNPGEYGVAVANILALAENGQRLMPLAGGKCCSEEARQRIQNSKMEDLFANGHAPLAALTGLYLYFSCRDEAHDVAQSDGSIEGSYWHAIIHRQEPDPGNSKYWFQHVGAHPVFAELLERARAIAAKYPSTSLKFPTTWDPLAFIDVCEGARAHADSDLERAALEIQRAEWQLLFDYCARRSSY
jgi:hypothetical protein